MVAEAKKPSTSRKGRGHAPNIDLLTRSKARNLYVVRQLGAQEVATQTGLTVPQVYSLAGREGWSKIRNQVKAKEEKASLAREDSYVEEMVQATASESAELTLSTFEKAREAIAKGGPMAAKDVQAWSQATKNYVGIYRQAKQLDAQQGGDANGAQINVMFVGALPRSAERITRNVTPSESASGAASAAQALPASPAQQDNAASGATLDVQASSVQQ